MAKGSIIVRKAFQEMQQETPDFQRAFTLLEKAAKQGNGEALYAIGTWYLHGRLVKKNLSMAIEFLSAATESNYPAAWFDLAICYEKGEGVKRNLKEAFACYLNAAIAGDKQAIHEVGRCYYYGIGISKNITLANIWLKQAAAQEVKG